MPCMRARARGQRWRCPSQLRGAGGAQRSNEANLARIKDVVRKEVKGLHHVHSDRPAAVAGGLVLPWLAEKLGAGALPAVTWLDLNHTHVGDAGASALAAARCRPSRCCMHLPNKQRVES